MCGGGGGKCIRGSRCMGWGSGGWGVKSYLGVGDFGLFRLLVVIDGYLGRYGYLG